MKRKSNRAILKRKTNLKKVYCSISLLCKATLKRKKKDGIGVYLNK